ncbi:Histone deacetylase B, partial [Dichanthelium oligosanthes]
ETDENSPSQQPRTDGSSSKKRVCYYYDTSISYVDYGKEHPMVPHRVAMTHDLVKSYGLLDDMDLLRLAPATKEDLEVAHSKGYLDPLRRLTPADYKRHAAVRGTAAQHDLGLVRDRHIKGCWINDNPVIEGLWDYCLRYAGGSLAAARALASGGYQIAINWSGGMHHACKGKASGFCYVNDIVVAIRALLARFQRVLYVDIDAHHGDGVESAFLEETRVMTVSFHQHDGKDFFPTTGDVGDVGKGGAMYHTLNPSCCKCGADSLAGDRITGLELTVRGHAKCVRLLRSYDVPLLLLGGGGYTINHVASCWCYETAVAIGKEISDDIPQHGYQRYYQSQGYKLHYYHETHSGNGNGNAKMKKMDTIKEKVMAHLDELSKLMAAPSTRRDEEPPRPVNIDGDALVDRSPRVEDPMERLHRRCGEMDLAEFLTDLGRKQPKRKKVDLELKC